MKNKNMIQGAAKFLGLMTFLRLFMNRIEFRMNQVLFKKSNEKIKLLIYKLTYSDVKQYSPFLIFEVFSLIC